jgi:hypothetical protein
MRSGEELSSLQTDHPSGDNFCIEVTTYYAGIRGKFVASSFKTGAEADTD